MLYKKILCLRSFVLDNFNDAALCRTLWEVNVSASTRKDILRQKSGIPQLSNSSLMPPLLPHMKSLICVVSHNFSFSHILKARFFPEAMNSNPKVIMATWYHNNARTQTVLFQNVIFGGTKKYQPVLLYTD